MADKAALTAHQAHFSDCAVEKVQWKKLLKIRISIPVAFQLAILQNYDCAQTGISRF